jgi:hypothetical protein
MRFANSAEFEKHSSLQMAMGVNLRLEAALVDLKGRALSYAQTGGILNPRRYELGVGSIIFRFGGGNAPAQKVAAGAWWLERREVEKLLAFANVHKITLPVATRYLALVPPEWSDMGLLVRARVRAPLLAWRGLGNSVAVRKDDGLGNVSLPHANEIAARRLNQLFVPGLWRPGINALTIEQSWTFTRQDAVAGWLYL